MMTEILAKDFVERIARELDKEAWRFRTCRPGSPADLRRDRSLIKAGRIWKAIGPLLKEKFLEISLSS
jgi:hypothetical protein